MNANSKAVQTAYRFLYVLRGERSNMGSQTNGKLPATIWQRDLEYILTAEIYRKNNWAESGVNIIAYDEDNPLYKTYLDMLNEPSKAVFESPVNEENGIVDTCMKPFYEGKETYQNCVKELEEQLGAYLQALPKTEQE